MDIKIAWVLSTLLRTIAVGILPGDNRGTNHSFRVVVIRGDLRMFQKGKKFILMPF
jgi:hypothetical protein